MEWQKNVQNDNNIAEHSVSPALSNNMLYLEFDIIHLGYHLLASGSEIFFFLIFKNSDSAIVQKCNSKSYLSCKLTQKDMYTKLAMLLLTFLYWLL